MGKDIKRNISKKQSDCAKTCPPPAGRKQEATETL